MPKKTLESLELELRDYAMTFPEATEDHPWGHRAIKVKGKSFLFLGGEKETKELSLSLKLPSSRDVAVDLPFAEPTGYGLGKSGWVSAGFKARDKLPLDLLADWIDESYRAVAPKRLLTQVLLARVRVKPSASSASRAQKTPAKPRQRRARAR